MPGKLITASTKYQLATCNPGSSPDTPNAKKITHRGFWVEPSLLAEIEYRAKSGEGKVRHPFFKGFRDDL